MNVASVVIGCLIVAYVMRDVFHTIFHPVGTGAIGEQVGKIVWRIIRNTFQARHRALSIAGPLAMCAVIMLWFAAMALGFALIYLPFMPNSFVFVTGVDVSRQHGLLPSLYNSLVIVTTLGYGDIAPRTAGLRLVTPLEGFLGLILFTASISWVLATYPAINRKRSMANMLTIVRDTEQDRRMNPLAADESFVGGLLQSLAEQFVTLRADLLQFPITYYFHAMKVRDEIANVVLYAHQLSARALEPRWPPGVRIAGAMLHDALKDYGSVMAEKYLALDRKTETVEVLQQFQNDQMPPGREGGDEG